jgi:hypothetical protein
MKTEIISSHPIRCYDNGGTTPDRFTALYMDQPDGSADGKPCFMSVGMSAEPFHPQGVGQHGAALPGRHLGKRIPFATMPEPCRRLILQDLAD